MPIELDTMPKKKRNDVAVKIDNDIARKARTIASYRGVPMAELLSDWLKPIADREFERFKKQLEKEQESRD